MKILRRAESTHAGLSDVMYYRGRLLEKGGDVEAAFQCYFEAISRNPEDFFALSRLAFGHLKRDDPNAAQDYFLRAIRCTPDAAPAGFRYSLHVGLGNTYVALNRPADAGGEYRIASQISPGSPEAWQGIQSVERK